MLDTKSTPPLSKKANIWEEPSFHVLLERYNFAQVRPMSRFASGRRSEFSSLTAVPAPRIYAAIITGTGVPG